MLKQTLFFSHPARLSLKDNQLVITLKDSNEMITRPIEDIGFVVIENQQIIFTIPLFSTLIAVNGRKSLKINKVTLCIWIFGWRKLSLHHVRT